MSLEDMKTGNRGIWIMPDIEKASLAELYELFDLVGDEIIIRTSWKKAPKA